MPFFVNAKLLSRTVSKIPDDKSRILCDFCKTFITEKRFLLVVQGDDYYHTFFNPSGFGFNVITFSHCESLLDASLPSGEFSWFNGYVWIIICCASCNEHLGWRFTSVEKSPSLFYALIREKLDFAE